MRYLTTILCGVAAAILTSCVTARSASQQTPKAFANLTEAVQFIADCLDQNGHSRLSGACVGGRGPTVYLAQYRRPFDMLQAAHKKKSLQDRYAKQVFPETTATFSLGGCMSEIGCLHIDFVKKDGRWWLRDIWDCK